jgi:formamidopyrimidine-DNA glycosylase
VPELPEVETVVRDLRPLLVGQRFGAVRAGRLKLRRPWSKGWGQRIEGRRIDEVGRRGKWIVVGLEDSQNLVVHLGMTGQLTVVSSATPHALHTHIVFDLRGGRSQLRFRDIRRFGSARLITDASALEQFFRAARLGPEPFALSRDYWRGALAGTARCLKAVLLDQRVVAGVGNIYADESLFEARLPPSQLGRQTRAVEADRLRVAIGKVLRRAIVRRGSSIRNYVGGSGLLGSYQSEFRVYGRTGEPCVRCGAALQRVRLAGRSTHFCPSCQANARDATRGLSG